MATSRKEPVPKKGTVSYGIGSVLRHPTQNKQQSPRCKVCLKSVGSKGSSTTNLLQHLKQRHAVKWERCCALRNEKARGSTNTPAKKQPTVLETFSNCNQYDKKGKAIMDAVAMHIAKDMVPIYTVEKLGFIHMLKVLDPRYVLPSRKYFSEVPSFCCFAFLFLIAL
ncbi:E3 SUMO-protein ligase ZBED1-like [Tachysurus ichikawai]